MTKSVATNQFPQIVWRDSKKYLWNPIQRKALKNRPEERVRLRIIEYLIAGGWSRHRISAEEALKSQKNSPSLRTDLICYTQNFDPFLLVECKAEQISINEKTATQIARYNQNIKAPYLLMTNGVHDFWYKVEEQHDIQSLDQIPAELPALEKPVIKPLSYWKERGFVGKNASSKLRKWFEKTMSACFLRHEKAARFLSFKSGPSDLDLNHYYIILPQTGYKLALSFSSTPFGGSRLIGIINKEKQNIGVLEINLDLLFDDQSPNASFYHADGIQNMNVDTYLDPGSESTQPDEFSTQLHSLLQQLIN